MNLTIETSKGQRKEFETVSDFELWDRVINPNLIILAEWKDGYEEMFISGTYAGNELYSFLQHRGFVKEIPKVYQKQSA